MCFKLESEGGTAVGMGSQVELVVKELPAC